MIFREMIFDTPQGDAKPLPTTAPRPLNGDRAPMGARDWAAIYSTLASYESAIDAAGFETEAEMKDPASPRKVIGVTIDDEGTVNGTWNRRSFELTASEIFTHFGRSIPRGWPGHEPELVWMGGPVEAVLREAYTAGPVSTTAADAAFQIGQHLGIGDVIVGMGRSGIIRAVMEKTADGFVEVEGGLQALRARLADSPEP
ncbi:hypothetical protein LAZ40_09900 [Cereibacter sphaeroides]|uniref:hypothetical protein n=1 Tax=Cereibacter sphaeroides TaxID=1063 RepID=UPI001F26741F|nr:hypothetical protein [Cereibacter sphaeroides]MCE6959364.1 hypothetical protein [Cereibacter sphaeroides]MCE6972956.1 hypothetical protein [Cereibacter sphaeroides]